MKRKKQKKQKPAKASPAAATPNQPPEQGPGSSRRDLLLKVRDYGAIALVLGGGGYFLADSFVAGAQEHDLSQIGNGMPTIVQIHDPQCPSCRALQKEVRAALADFDDSEVQYLVANIRTDEGGRFANYHRVQHVTLVLLDGNGNRREVLTGQRPASSLRQAFRKHIDEVTGGGGLSGAEATPGTAPSS
ncbi:MAG: thioredoxin family protein [Alphaproteobacteria bacterium]|nr:thioredoxin family protein [Alphaproteobacteria bacterium SS10]